MATQTQGGVSSFVSAKRAKPARAGLPPHGRSPGVARPRSGGLSPGLARVGTCLDPRKPAGLASPGALQPLGEPLAESQNKAIHDRLMRTDGAFAPPGVAHLDVLSALQSLPAKQRQALVLVAIVDMTTAEAAREMGANEGTVHVWVSRGREAMATLLGFDAVPVIESGGHDD